MTMADVHDDIHVVLDEQDRSLPLTHRPCLHDGHEFARVRSGSGPQPARSRRMSGRHRSSACAPSSVRSSGGRRPGCRRYGRCAAATMPMESHAPRIAFSRRTPPPRAVCRERVDEEAERSSSETSSWPPIITFSSAVMERKQLQVLDTFCPTPAVAVSMRRPAGRQSVSSEPDLAGGHRRKDTVDQVQRRRSCRSRSGR